MLYDLGFIAMQSSPPWYTKFVSAILLASIVSKPSVFWTQLLPYGAFRAVELQEMSSNLMFVPFMIFSDQRGESLTETLASTTLAYALGRIRQSPLTVFHENVAHIPEDEWHRSPGLGVSLFHIVPRIAIAVNPSSAVAVDVDSLTGNDESCVMILECDGVGVIAPVCQIVGELI